MYRKGTPCGCGLAELAALWKHAKPVTWRCLVRHDDHSRHYYGLCLNFIRPTLFTSASSYANVMNAGLSVEITNDSCSGDGVWESVTLQNFRVCVRGCVRIRRETFFLCIGSQLEKHLLESLHRLCFNLHSSSLKMTFTYVGQLTINLMTLQWCKRFRMKGEERRFVFRRGMPSSKHVLWIWIWNCTKTLVCILIILLSFITK
jgi:hypothetical protein